ncbi:LysR substrate-binding domain-containing protein [Aestuariivirga sp.]|uniref:LysR substrate-binding domain-containing protein n=1 Tax=Aestuariivirga sp. TaxID=2650926 RepID=UPI0039E5CFD3
MKRNVSLSGFRVFESAARLLSFTAAAGELALTPSAVSHQIAGMEEALGTRLFQRTPQGLLLTHDGETLKPYITAAFNSIEQGKSLVMADGTRPQTLRLQVYITIAVRWLVSRLADFRDAFPHIEVRLDTTIMDWDFDPNHADLGFIYTISPKRDGVEYAAILRAGLVLVCSKALASAPLSRSALSKCTKIEVPGAPLDWEIWQQHNRCAGITFANTLQFDSLVLAVEAARQGLGVLVVPDFIVRDDITAGLLVTPFGRTVPQLGQWYLAYSNARKFDKSVIAFRKWLKDQIAA